jgi:hypothetical protein
MWVVVVVVVVMMMMMMMMMIMKIKNNTIKTAVQNLRLERYWHCLVLVLEDCDARLLEASSG